MNTYMKCNCCCKENVCKYKETYEGDCAQIKGIYSPVTEVSVRCKEFQANQSTPKSIDTLSPNDKADMIKHTKIIKLEEDRFGCRYSFSYTNREKGSYCGLQILDEVVDCCPENCPLLSTKKDGEE